MDADEQPRDEVTAPAGAEAPETGNKKRAKKAAPKKPPGSNGRLRRRRAGPGGGNGRPSAKGEVSEEPAESTSPDAQASADDSPAASSPGPPAKETASTAGKGDGPTPEPLELAQLKAMSIQELSAAAMEMGLDEAAGLKKHDLIFEILQTQARTRGLLYAEGVLELMPDGYGFLRAPESNYLAGPDDIYVSPSQIRRFSMRTGDTVSGQVRSPKDGERYFALVKIQAINFDSPEVSRDKVIFDNLTPLYPNERILLETQPDNMTARVLDMFTPQGKGQRGLIVAAPRTGKTLILQNIAHSIAANHPEVFLIVLLVDERTEEVTDLVRSVQCEVVSSTFDEPATRHVQVA